MKRSQLVQMIQQLLPEELSELELFVNSPFFNRGGFVKETKVLLNIILSTSPEYDEEKLLREKVYRVIFPNNAQVDGKMDKVMSELHKMVKEFVTTRMYLSEENEFNQLKDLYTFYRNRNMINRYQYVISKIEEMLTAQNYHDSTYYERQYILNNEKHHFQALFNRKRDDINTQKALESLDISYLVNKMELLNYYLLQQKIAKISIPEEILLTIRESHLPARYAKANPGLLIAYTIFQLMGKDQPDIEEYTYLHEQLRNNEKQISPEDLKVFYTYLRNILIIQYNSGKVEVMPVLFELQKEHFQRGYLHYNGKISATAFISLVMNGLRSHQFSWVEKFIQNQKGQLSQDPDDDYYNLAQAVLHFANAQYDEALSVLPPSIKDLDYLFIAKRLELKVYYETHSELLPYKIDAFKMYVSRASQKLISPMLKEPNSNFINILFQLINVPKGNKAKMNTLLKRLDEKGAISDRDWLLEKIKELGEG